MPTLFGNSYTRADVQRHVGLLSQLGGVTPFDFTDGPARGTRGLLLHNAAGLSLTVHPDRCLDIGAASYKGVPLAWTSLTGFPSPMAYEPEGLGWLRSFGGGLVATCGLTNAGVPTDDLYGKTGLHGRIGNTPASEVSHGGIWHGDDYALVVTGSVRETRVFGENLVLKRTLTLPIDKAVIAIEDEITNEGYAPSPLMVLYHCNFGFPLIGPDTRLEGNFASVIPRDAEAEQGKERAQLYEAPTPSYKEKCYWLDPIPDLFDEAVATLVNPALGLQVGLYYFKSELPCFTQWKQMGEGTYTVGLEPGNVLPLGRAHYIDNGTLPMLAPGETRRFAFEIQVKKID